MGGGLGGRFDAFNSGNLDQVLNPTMEDVLGTTGIWNSRARCAKGWIGLQLGLPAMTSILDQFLFILT